MTPITGMIVIIANRSKGQMTKMLKGFAVGLLIVIAAMAPACRSTRKKNTKTTSTATTATTATVPDVPVTATTEMKVDTQPADFVQTDTAPKPTVEVLPADVEQANRTAQDRGYVRDAFFGYDESTLNADAQAALSASATWLKQNPRYNILIEGHTDERGTEQYNLALGDRRASIVRDFLITLGVDAGRIRTVSYGEERPFDPNHNEAAWAKNRRGHLVLVGTSR
jgi:peptidoglycan-associated lipoprotein